MNPFRSRNPITALFAWAVCAALLPSEARAQLAVFKPKEHLFHIVLEPHYTNFIPKSGFFDNSFGAPNHGGGLRVALRSEKLLGELSGNRARRYGITDLALTAGYSLSHHRKVTAAPDLGENVKAIPMDLTLAYHFRYSENQWFWPTLGGGGDVIYYLDAVTYPSVPARQGESSGLRYGWHAELQLNADMDRFDRYSAKTAKFVGLTETVLFARGIYRVVNRHADTPYVEPYSGTVAGPRGLDFSGWVVAGGLSLQFR